MSTYGVRRRFVDLLVREGGRVSEARFGELVAYARERGITAGELKALLQPADYLRTSRVLRSHGIGIDDVALDAGAWAIATALGRELGVTRIFPGMPRARPTERPPTPEPRPTPTPARGTSLGAMSEWKLETSGARLEFVTRAGDKVYPAVVLRSPQWSDPGPTRDLVAEHRAALREVNSLAKLISFVRDVVAREREYLDAEGVTTRSKNERYGIQDQRRHAFFQQLERAASELRLGSGERARVPAVLGGEKERLLCDRDYVMETGSHTNYWPYWDNYRGAIEKILAQTPPGSDEYFTIKNRLEEIFDRKTVFGFQREVDEKNMEESVGGAVVHRLPYTTGNGHRVSLAQGSWPTAPVYEVLSVASTGLPEGLEKHAGEKVYRDVDSARTLRFDPGGARVPDELVRHVQGRKVEAGELGLRPLGSDERPRAGIPFDWNRDGGIQIVPIEIGWWGHCHNEAPLNAMGVDPKRGVKLYRAHRGVPADKALQSFSSEDVWDVFGALTADHESGYAVIGSFGPRETQVEETKFVGSRHDGGHWFLIEPARQGARRVRIDAEVTELWHKSDPSKKYDSPEARFRRDLPNEDGTFDPNPDWVAADVDDEDEITIDCLGRRVTFTTTYITFDDSGERYEKKETVALDPTKDEWLKLAEEILHAGRRGGRLAEHWYNAKQQRYYRTIVEVSPEGRRRETERAEPAPVARALSRQETAYDSVIDIHDFVTKNMGLPFTFDTSSGLAVWNYPVKSLRIDRSKEVERVEGGKVYTYTSYRLKYSTMGGPDGDSRYIVKRDEQGNAVRAVALDPMPDFAYRNEYWVCAPATNDPRGQMAFNVQALQSGFLTDKQREKIIPELWRRQAALCYASLAAPGEGDTVHLFEKPDGELVVFPDEAAFQAAVDADRRAR